MTLPEHLGLFILGVSVVLALALVIFGAVRVQRSGAALKRRLDAYRDLPVVKLVALTESRLTGVERRAAGLPELRRRATVAGNEIGMARKRTVAIAQLVFFALRKFVGPVSSRPAPLATTGRNREN